LLTVEADPTVRCVVITGAGRAFCAGGDVSGMGGNADAGSRPPAQTSLQDAVRRLKHGQETLTLRLFDLAKPTIAALPGPAAGAGLSIALACDLRIAAASAFLVTAFANIGLSGDYGGSWLLTQLIGVARAKELYYTSRRVAADEALALGIVNEVVPDERLAARTRELAQTIASGPPIALAYMKQNLNRAVGADLRACLAEEAERMVRCTRTDDHREAVRAFLEKRKPTFTGR
jgi:2-(1,2-epoxy-1,2-dihydrophenyl)acetyl-CoA isomerase